MQAFVQNDHKIIPTFENLMGFIFRQSGQAHMEVDNKMGNLRNLIPTGHLLIFKALKWQYRLFLTPYCRDTI